MSHPIYRVITFKIVGPHALKLDFDDGTAQTIDFRPMLAGELYGPLQDVTLFNQVEIDSEAHTLVWPNGADFDPAILHDWPKHEKAMVRLARRWAKAQVKAIN